jgi:hypothetical protein
VRLEQDSVEHIFITNRFGYDKQNSPELVAVFWVLPCSVLKRACSTPRPPQTPPIVPSRPADKEPWPGRLARRGIYSISTLHWFVLLIYPPLQFYPVII